MDASPKVDVDGNARTASIEKVRVKFSWSRRKTKEVTVTPTTDPVSGPQKLPEGAPDIPSATDLAKDLGKALWQEFKGERQRSVPSVPGQPQTKVIETSYMSLDVTATVNSDLKLGGSQFEVHHIDS